MTFFRKRGIILIMEMNEELVLIDGNSLINRAFYALPMLTDKDGVPINAVYGFANILVRLIENYRPKYMVVAFDVKAKTFRHNMYEGYKATRKGMPDELAVQLPLLKKMLGAIGIKCVEKEGIEADDIIGTLSKKHALPTYILTGDRDSFQLIDDSTTVLFTRKGISETDEMTPASLKADFGLSPSQIVDFKALAGDASDNIPGVQGIGEKRAKELLSTYGSVAEVYAHLGEIKGKLHDNLENGRQSCDLSYALATIKTDCDIDVPLSELTYVFPFSEEAHEFFEHADFKSVLRRTELFGGSVETARNYEEVKRMELAGAGELAVVCDKNDSFAVTFGDVLSVSADGKLQYDLPLRVDLLGGGADEPEAIRAIAPRLADEKVVKYVYDAKAVKGRLAAFRAELNGYEDVALMDYLSQAGFKYTSARGFAETLGMNADCAAGALIVGGKELLGTLKAQGMEKLYREIELPLVEVLYDMQKTGFLLDLKLLGELKEKYAALERESTEKIYALAGKRFNVNSPKQLAAVLFDDLGIKYPKKGSYSTSAEILTRVQSEHPIVSEVLRYRFISKIKSTYLDGLSKVAGSDGVVHTEFNQMQTSTGRLSSSEPNLQNIPVREEEGKILRALFIAREGHTLISADYSQIELRVMAHLSADENLIEAYREGRDIHTAVARELFGTEEPDARERRVAKTVNFGIIYGMSAFGLGERLGIAPSKAKSYIDRYFARYPGVKRYLENVVAEAKEKGYAESLFGRRRVIAELKSGDFRQRSFGERAAMNMPLQSTAADIIKVAMLKVYKALAGMKSKLVLQVHDELIIDSPEDEAESVAAMLKHEMENAVKLRVPLVAEVRTGRSWMDCK